VIIPALTRGPSRTLDTHGCWEATLPNDAQAEDSHPGIPAALPPEIAASIDVLVADGERTVRDGCAILLQSLGFTAVTTAHAADALALVRRRRFDLVLFDLQMDAPRSLDIVREMLVLRSETVIIATTDNPSVADSLEAIRAGVWDYLPKPFSASHLEILVGRAAHDVLSGRARPRHLQDDRWMEGEECLLGSSLPVRNAVEQARRVAPTTASVMLLGEHGTGKARIARFIHASSSRADKVFLVVNCGSVSEAELFGHEADGDSDVELEPGLIEVAAGGTILLNELADLPALVQASLLRVLQRGALPPQKRGKPSTPINVRFISSLEHCPEQHMRGAGLRRDLVKQLSSTTIRLPALRERPEDIPGIAQFLLRCCWEMHHNNSSTIPTLSTATLDWMKSLPWRGNVRQVLRAMERLSLIAAPNSEIEPDQVPLINDIQEEGAGGIYAAILDNTYLEGKDKLVEAFEREYLPRLVSRAKGNMTRAAKMAEVDRKTLYRMMERHGLRRGGDAEVTAPPAPPPSR
jgi:DNA-binding NtrC family response regulator